MKKTYLVTGGTGFIGHAPGAPLAARRPPRGRFWTIIPADRPAVCAMSSADIEFVSADVREPQAVIDAARGVDSILHLAYVNGTEFFYTKPALVLDVGVRGMLNVLDACRQHGIRELVLASSSEVYQTPPRIPTAEDAPFSVPDPLNPRYSYGGGKIICELMAINYGRQDFDRVLVFRPHNVYGPDMGWEHVLPQFALRLKRLSAKVPQGVIPFPIQGTGRETRSFIHIDDFTAALILVLEQGQHLNIYHIGTEDSADRRGRPVRGRLFRPLDPHRTRRDHRRKHAAAVPCDWKTLRPGLHAAADLPGRRFRPRPLV